MNALAWVERNPVFYFVCASSVLLYIYGFWWTIVLLFTLYLIDEAFKDPEEEKIYGKLLNIKQKFNPFHNKYNRNIVNPTSSKMFSNNKKSEGEKKLSLQDLVNLKRGKGHVTNVTQNNRQPLAAIVKNNMNIQLSSVDLEKRKPLYQGMRSVSPSRVSTRLSKNTCSPLVHRRDESYRLYSGSPLLNRSIPNDSILMNGSYINRSPSLNRSYLNTPATTSINNTATSPLNNSLEVHGSYFINKSVFHSPSEKTVNNTSATPSNVTFHKNIRNSISTLPVKCSTESVVEALKQKSKRKRVQADSTDELDLKKKKTDDMDSTLNDLLPNNDTPVVEQVLSSKRKNICVKELISTGIQCVIGDEETAAKKKKLQAETTPKYGLSQVEVNELSSKCISSDTGKPEEISIVDKETDETDVTPKSAMKDLIKDIAHDCSLPKSVTFSDHTPDKTELAKQEESIVSKSSVKLSALKNMESPYKRLFKDGALKNITPESMKKMRKHPMYFTAKIDIDEIQQHREEYGQSGVSLKAFRLDKEEAIKRVDSVFNESDSDIDFNLKPASEVMVTSSALAVASTISLGISTNLASTTLTSSSIQSNLFGGAAPSSVGISLTSALSASNFSFGNSTTSLTSLPPITSTATIPSASTTATALPSLQNNSVLTTTELKPSSFSVSTTSTTFNFNALPATSILTSTQSSLSATTIVPSAQAPVTSESIIKLPQLSTPANFSFGLGGGTLTSTVQPALQFPTTMNPIVSSAATIPAVGALPTTLSALSSSSTSLPTNPQFNFSFPPQATTINQLNQSIAGTTTACAQTTTLPSNGLFGTTASTSQSFNFGTGSAPKDLPSATSGFSFSATTVPATNPPISTSIPNNIFGTTNALASVPTMVTTQPILFGTSTAAPTVATATTFQTPLFGNSVASVAPSTTAFGAAASQPSGGFNTASTAISSVPNNIFAAAAQGKVNGFSFASTAAPATGFSFTSTTSASGFSFASTTSTSGFSFATATTASSGFNFGSAASTATATFGVSSAPTASQSIFGQTVSNSTTNPAPQNLFGASAASSTATQGIFGAASTVPSSQNIFGAPASSAPTTQSIFGAPSASVPATQNIFGNATQNTFGSNGQNTFGSSNTQNVFGAAQQPSIFGDQSKNSSGFNFGTSTTTTTSTGGFSFSTGTTNSVFGQSNNVFGSAPATNNAGVFGAAKPTENPFGQQAKPSGGFDFSGSLSSAPTINFGAPAAPTANAFNAQQPNEIQKPSFNFGSQPATPTFGAAPASPAFGNIPQPAFGSPQPFGTPAPAGGGFTIGTGTSNPQPSRQTQRARRRIRR